MDWLCEATPEEIVRVVRRTNTMKELKAAVRKYVIRRIKGRNIYDPICSECGTTTTTRTTILKRSLAIRGFAGSRDICFNMLQPGTGTRYGSSLEASPEEGDTVRGKVMRISDKIVVMKNGPVTIFATTDKRVTVGENYRVKVLSVTLISGKRGTAPQWKYSKRQQEKAALIEEAFERLKGTPGLPETTGGLWYSDNDLINKKVEKIKAERKPKVLKKRG
ncbi:Hypothetical predicted protein [Paramuricea clavata]|uniref:Uncharacterized protein n=1 Tax=Paramuricea clavata TaxID=317549 RepID=A0A6S7FJ92_PARCT|nr:Hypothetical predicted protein [Paramuricea clavata]